jgi:hypothetical protein
MNDVERAQAAPTRSINTARVMETNRQTLSLLITSSIAGKGQDAWCLFYGFHRHQRRIKKGKLLRLSEIL